MEKFDPSKMKVELRRHYGQQATEHGIVDVDLKQCRVWLNGKCVGIYCGLEDVPGKHLSFTDIPPLPEPIQKAVADEVAKLTGGISHFTAPPPEEHEVVTDDDE